MNDFESAYVERLIKQHRRSLWALTALYALSLALVLWHHHAEPRGVWLCTEIDVNGNPNP